jgi:hypothetical protein
MAETKKDALAAFDAFIGSTANAKIALTSATHCAATPVPPVAMLPDRRFSNGSRPQSVNIAQSRSQMES